MWQKFDVIVVGGGIVGLTAAIGMAQRKFSVAVLDAGSITVDKVPVDTRVYAINQASKNLLQQLAIWQNLDQTRLSPYRQMHVWDAATNALIQFDATMVAEQNLGYIIEESVLKETLLQQIKQQKNISIFPHSQVTWIESLDMGVCVAAGTNKWQANLLMVADGANSFCRQLLSVPLTTWPYHQDAIIALVKVEKDHQKTAYQVFNTDGPLAFLPMAEKNLCSIVWSVNPSRAQQLMAASPAAFNQELTTAFAQRLGAVTLQSTRQKFPLIMRHTRQYVGAGWLLLGDAAHTIHPLAGLGLNVGLADVSTWLACLDAEQKSLTAKKMLGAYQRQRKHAVWKVIALMEGLKTIFSNPLLAPIRGIGLQACNNMPALKRLFIEQAAGCELGYFAASF